MNTPEQLRTMMYGNEQDLDIQPVNVIDAYPLCYRIQQRKMFSEYCSETGYKSIAPKIETYFQQLDVPAISSTSAQRIKTVLLKNINRNYHTEALLSGAAQAYFDLCLFMGVTGICTRTNELNYNQAISAIRTSLDTLEKEYDSTCEIFSKLETGELFKSFQPVIEKKIDFNLLKEMFNRSVQIIKLYQEDRAKYDQSYDSIVASIDVCLKESEDDIFFSHVVTMLKNKERFTIEEMDYVNQAYTNRFSEQEQQSLISSIPDNTPSIEDTKIFFFKEQVDDKKSIFTLELDKVAV